jgi:hypothetical protein
MRSINFRFDNAKKRCTGRDCERIGTKILKLRFLNRTGIFCEACAEDLLAADLASNVEDEAVRDKSISETEKCRFWMMLC